MSWPALNKTQGDTPMCVACDHTIHRASHHFGWNRDFTPTLTAKPGSTIHFECSDSSAGQLGADSTVQSVIDLDFGKINPVTGPVYVEGAEPGDVLKVTIREFVPSGIGWTANIPGFGLLADQFKDPAIHVWSYDAKSMTPALYGPGGRVPLKPFAGTIGVAPAEPGLHSIVPPRGSAATSTSATSPRASRSTCRWRYRARCSRSATPTPPRATARSAAPPSRAR